jgi:hypothetical protein
MILITIRFFLLYDSLNLSLDMSLFNYFLIIDSLKNRERIGRISIQVNDKVEPRFP